MEYIIWFLMSYVLIYLIYYFVFIRKAKRDYKIPAEAQYLIYQYKLDTTKFSYRKFIRIVGTITSLDIAIVATIVGNVDGLVWQILFGFVVVVPVIILSFMLLGKYYQKKQTKNNTKELEKEKRYLEKKENKKNRKGKKKNG